jgi:hypothetical protein
VTSEGSTPHVIRTVEARWILRGVLPPSVIDWFSRLPSSRQSRQDVYLIAAARAGMSVKIRGGHTLDVKAASADPLPLQAGSSVCGETRAWEKWSFPLPALDDLGVGGWLRVDKDRRIAMFPAGAPLPHPGPDGRRPGCAVELTSIEAGRNRLWTLAFEAADEKGSGRSHLEAAATEVFDEPLPDGLQLGLQDAMSYVDWLRRGSA